MQAFDRQFSPYELTQLQRHGITVETARQGGEQPVEYLTGHVDFAGLDFLVTSDVLIPRVETEELVALVVDFITKQFSDQIVTIAEIGTGSGAISLAVADKLIQARRQFKIVSSDISANALKVAHQNQLRLFQPNLDHQTLEFIHSDLWQNFSADLFNVVIANLPYIPTARLATLDPSVIEFEPRLALDGGNDGLAVIRRLLQDSHSHLATDARLFLEVDTTHTQPKLSSINQDFSVKTFSDQFGKNRFAELRLLHP